MPPVHFHTGRFPPKDIDWTRLIPLLSPASAALARFDGILMAMTNADILLAPLTTREAVLSSRIEGTQATMGEVLEYEAETGGPEPSPSRLADIHEIINYRRAMDTALHLMEELPLCQRVVKAAHEVLLSGVRGENRAPGQYRTILNWIGPPGCAIDHARYVPVAADQLPQAMGDWEQFLHADYMDKLVQLALAHAQFEAVHPFLDGNGRLGRMLIPLFLHQAGVLSRPAFYMSAFLESRRDEYYDRLLAVSSNDDWTGWCEFFLQGVIHQARENQDKARRIVALHQDTLIAVADWTRSQYAPLAVEFLFQHPIFKVSSFAGLSGLPAPTARRIISQLDAHGLFDTLRPARGRRPATYAFRELLNIAEGDTVR